MPGLSFPPPPRSWHYSLTCSFSEYGLLRTTGTLPFPHRSLKTRSFSTPRGSGLCDLPSRSLKGKAGGSEDCVKSGVTSWLPWSGNPESFQNFRGSPTWLYVEPARFGCPARYFVRITSKRWEGILIVKHKGELTQAGAHPSSWTSLRDGHAMGLAPPPPLPHLIDLKSTGSPSPCRTPGQGDGHQT